MIEETVAKCQKLPLFSHIGGHFGFFGTPEFFDFETGHNLSFSQIFRAVLGIMMEVTVKNARNCHFLAI